MNLKSMSLWFILSFSVSAVFAQNGYAYYKKQVSFLDDNATNSTMKQAIAQLQNQEYELAFSSNNALFKKNEALSMENNLVLEAFTQALSGFTGEVYFDRINNAVIHKTDFLGSSFLISKNSTKWALTRDTLKIDRYLCYKATTIQTIENTEGVHELKVTAWYAPEIPLPYGPDGYGGLPGLILQLENNSIVTIIKKIEFLNDKIIKISPPTKGKEITEEAFRSVIKKRFENRKDNKN